MPSLNIAVAIAAKEGARKSKCILLCWPAGTPQDKQDQPKTKTPSKAASASASGSKSKDAKSGFDDVVVPDESGAGPSGGNAQGAVPGRAGQDDDEPEATLPGGTATEGAESGPSKAHTSDNKQKQLDWSAAASRKRKANGGAHALHGDNGHSAKQPTRTPPKRQCKLKFASS